MRNFLLLLLSIITDGSCQRSFTQTAYRTAKTTITCDYNPNDSRLKFFCKEIGSVCEDILSTKSSLKSDGTFTLTETNRGFNVSISNVSSQHTGVYWCGAKSKEGSYRYALKKIQLEVKESIRNITKSPTIGQNLTYWCTYPPDAPEEKFICKGEDPSICEHLVSTAHSKTTGKFSMMDDYRIITITVINVTAGDTGTYWCGGKSVDEGRSNPFFHKCQITAIQPTTPTFPVSSTPSTTASAQSHGGTQVFIIVIICLSVLLLMLFGLILILIYKRHPKKERSRAAAQHIEEEYIYEEIQEHPKRPDSGNAMNPIYDTADLPTNPSASLHYSTIIYQNCSDNGEALIKSRSSACKYSTVKDSQRPIYSAVTQPSSEDLLYSTVSKPQEE